MTATTTGELRRVIVRLAGPPGSGVETIERRWLFEDPEEAWLVLMRALTAGLDAETAIVRTKVRGRG